jgi:hypothetical protein
MEWFVWLSFGALLGAFAAGFLKSFSTRKS